jgi:hypothetical protein
MLEFRPGRHGFPSGAVGTGKPIVVRAGRLTVSAPPPAGGSASHQFRFTRSVNGLFGALHVAPKSHEILRDFRKSLVRRRLNEVCCRAGTVSFPDIVRIIRRTQHNDRNNGVVGMAPGPDKQVQAAGLGHFPISNDEFREWETATVRELAATTKIFHGFVAIGDWLDCHLGTQETKSAQDKELIVFVIIGEEDISNFSHEGRPCVVLKLLTHACDAAAIESSLYLSRGGRDSGGISNSSLARLKARWRNSAI